MHWGRETENAETLQWFRDEIRKAYGGRAPKVLDPFAGGGAIPLEAMRLGCEATAVDINPVAWFLLKCTLEYPQKLAGQVRALGQKIVSELYDIFQRQREAAVQPVEKDDVAEVLRRRLFDADAVKHRDTWQQHVIAALKGVYALDDQTAKQGAVAEERYLKSYPFHPELTEVFYSKWASGIERFQKTRGVLRTFALALREAEKWDESPLVGPAVFLGSPKQEGLSEAARELVSIADTIVDDGQATRWTGIVESELACARQVQADSVGLRLREIEQAVMATFLHSQPKGRSAKTRELMLLIGPCRPDKIELEKGFNRWSSTSSWLDDEHKPEKENQLRAEWRLGNRPNLNQMQAAAAAQIQDDVVKARLIEEIGKLKTLTSGASASGVRVHTLPTKPKDIEDDGLFHYAVLLPSAASESGKPSAEAKRFLDETTGSDKPRVFRNAVLLLAASKDGLNAAEARVRDHMAWERVLDDLTPKSEEERKQKGAVDVARLQTLKLYIDKAKARVPESIRQAYCIVVTVSDKDDAGGETACAACHYFRRCNLARTIAGGMERRKHECLGHRHGAFSAGGPHAAVEDRAGRHRRLAASEVHRVGWLIALAVRAACCPDREN